jgi:hypothetical protein
LIFLTQRYAEVRAKGRGGGLEIVDEAFDAVFEVGDVEVDEESEFTVG